MVGKARYGIYTKCTINMHIKCSLQRLLKIQATLMGVHTTVTVINLKHLDEFHHEFGWKLRFLNILHTKEEGSYTCLGGRTFPPYTS
jgi:hypothetical protein